MGSGDRWESRILREGLGYLPIPMLPEGGDGADFGFRMWGLGREMAPPLAESLRELKPELVATDTLTIPGAFAAGLLGVPWVEVVPHVLQLPSRALPPIGAGLVPGRTPVGKTRDAILRWFTARSLAVADRERIEARRAIGLPDEGPPVLRLIGTLPAMEWPRPDWPAEAHLVGPLEWEPQTDELALPPGDRPLVFVADSTAWGREQSLLDASIEGLAGEVRIVATRLGEYDTSRLPGGVSVGPGRQTDLLPHADVVVCPGGGGLLGKALVRGKPLVVVPGPGDQRENGVRAAATGAAIVLRSSAGPREIATAVRRILGDARFTAAARRAAATADGLGADYAAGLVETVLP